MIRWTVLILSLLVMNGCQVDEEELSSVDLTALSLHTVQPAPPESIQVAFTGVISNLQPAPHKAPISWAPVAWVIEEGAAIQPNDTLIRYETDNVEYSAQKHEINRDISQTKAKGRILTLGVNVDVALQEKRELQAQQRVQAAKFAAAQEQAADDIAIAELNLRSAQRRFESSQLRHQRVQALFDQGHATRRQLTNATNALATSEAGLEVAQIQLRNVSGDVGYVDRQRAQMELDKLSFKLGSDNQPGLIDSKIENFKADETRRVSIDSNRQNWSDRSYQKKLDFLANPQQTAPADGVVQYASSDLKPGSKLGRVALFTLTDDTLTARFMVDQEQRDLIALAQNKAQGKVTLSSPALGHVTLDGSVTGVGTVIENSADGERRGFWCTVEIISPDTELLRYGMEVDCVLSVPVAESAVRIPIWCVTDINRPAITLSDGTRIEVEGRVIGDHMVIDHGLDAGTIIRIPRQRPEQGVVRLAAPLQLVDYTEQGVSNYGLQLVSILPDGTDVEVGQTIAEFSFRNGNDPEKWAEEVALRPAEAKIELDQTRTAIHRTVAEALAEYQKSEIQANGAELEALVTRYSTTREAVARAEAADLSANIKLKEAQLAFEALSNADLRAAVSDQRSRKIKIDYEIEKINRFSQKLSTLAAHRSKNIFSVWESDFNLDRKREESQISRSSHQLARQQAQLSLHKAQYSYLEALKRVREEQIKLADLNVPSTAQGRLFHDRDRWGRPLSIGGTIPKGDFANVEIGPRRRVTLEVPVRLYPVLRDSKLINLQVPALGDQPIPAPIVHVGAAFIDSTQGAQDLMIPGYVGRPERVFTCVAMLNLSPQQARQAPPGVTAFVDVELP